MIRITLGATVRASVFLLAIPLVACGKKNDAAVTDTTTMSPSLPQMNTAPAQVTDIQVGKSIGADKRVADQTTTFGPRDTMYVAVITDGAANAAKLTTKWTFNDKQVVKEASQTISPAGGTSVTEFHMDKKSAWPLGKYKVEVMLNGVSAGTKDIEVKAP
jgi:flagellar hook assembly protein FlgD